MPDVGWWVAVATFLAGVAVVAGVTYRSEDAVALVHFLQWTNAFFLWPALRAVDLGAFSEAVVFAATFYVSTLHHGCVPGASLRAAVATDTYVLLGAGSVVLVGATAVLATRRRPAYRGFAAVSALALVALASLALFGVAIESVAAGRLDGCAYAHEPGDVQYSLVAVPRLIDIWSTADFVTAFAALVVVLVFFFQPVASIELGIFWLFVVIVLVGTLFDHAQLLSDGVFFATVAGVAALMVAGRLTLWCCFDPRERTRRALERYNVWDVVAGLLLGAVALAVFVGHNEPSFHGWWHVLAAAALFLVTESIYSTGSSGAIRQSVSTGRRPSLV